MIFEAYIPVFNAPAEGGGPAAAPAEPAPAAPVSAPETAPAGGEVDETTDFVLNAFEPMTQDFDEIAESPPAEVIEAPAEPTAPAPIPPAAPAAVVPAQTPAAPAAPAVSTPTAAPVAAPPTVAPPSVGSPSVAAAPAAASEPKPGDKFDQLADELAKQQKEFVQVLAEHQYKLSDEDLEAFASDPRKVISRVAAEVQVATTASVLKVLAAQMPVYVHGLMQARARHSEAENRFWSANPGLDRSKHREVVTQVMQTVRQMQPQMKADDFIRTVGHIAAGMAGVQAAAPNGAAVRPISTPGPVVRQVHPAFTPAGAQTAPPSAHPQPVKGEWERMTELFLADESGAFET